MSITFSRPSRTREIRASETCGPAQSCDGSVPAEFGRRSSAGTNALTTRDGSGGMTWILKVGSGHCVVVLRRRTPDFLCFSVGSCTTGT